MSLDNLCKVCYRKVPCHSEHIIKETEKLSKPNAFISPPPPPTSAQRANQQHNARVWSRLHARGGPSFRLISPLYTAPYLLYLDRRPGIGNPIRRLLLCTVHSQKHFFNICFIFTKKLVQRNNEVQKKFL